MSNWRDREDYLKLNDKQKEFLEVLIELKGDAHAAVKRVYSSQKLHEIMNSSLLLSFIEEISREILALNTLKAVNALADNLDKPNRLGAQNALNTAKELLDRVGIVKKEQEQRNIRPAIFILPPKDTKVIEGSVNGYAAIEYDNEDDEDAA
jgi:hypothetical protein